MTIKIPTIAELKEKLSLPKPWDIVVIFLLNILITIPVFLIAHQNLIDLNRDYIANLGKSEVEHSNKLHSLMNEDLAYFKSIEDKKKVFTEQSRTYILEAEKAKLKLVIDNEKLTTETRQEAFRQNVIQ